MGVVRVVLLVAGLLFVSAPTMAQDPFGIGAEREHITWTGNASGTLGFLPTGENLAGGVRFLTERASMLHFGIYGLDGSARVQVEVWQGGRTARASITAGGETTTIDIEPEAFLDGLSVGAWNVGPPSGAYGTGSAAEPCSGIVGVTWADEWTRLSVSFEPNCLGADAYELVAFWGGAESSAEGLVLSSRAPLDLRTAVRGGDTTFMDLSGFEGAAIAASAGGPAVQVARASWNAEVNRGWSASFQRLDLFDGAPSGLELTAVRDDAEPLQCPCIIPRISGPESWAFHATGASAGNLNTAYLVTADLGR